MQDLSENVSRKSKNDTLKESLLTYFRLVLQHFEDFLNNVEVSKNLTDNRISEMAIKSDEVKTRVDSLKNKIELKFEEMFDSLNELREDVLSKFEVFWTRYFQEFEGCCSSLEEKLGHFDQILEQIQKIQSDVTLFNPFFPFLTILEHISQ